MAKYNISIVIEKDQDGYFAFCPELDGCFTQGSTYEEVIENIRDAAILHIEDRIEDNEPVPLINEISLASMEVVVT